MDGVGAARRLPRRVLLRGVRARREPADLLGRARGPRRRPSQGGVGARRPARRDRPLLPPRLLPPAARRARPAGRALPADRTRPACRSSSYRWRPSWSSRTTSGELVPVRLGVWRAQVGRVSLYLIDTHVDGNPDWARSPTPLRRRPGEPAPAGAAARRRRRPRAAPARPRADRLPPERGPLGVPPARADARASRGAGPRDRRGARAAPRLDRLHDAHAGAGGERGVRPRARAASNLGGLVARCGLGVGGVRRARQVEPGDNALRADAVRAPHVAVRERRLGAARRGVAGDVAPTLARPTRSHEVPITSVTNGVHQRTWISGELEELLGDTDPQFERARDISADGPVGCASQRETAAARLHRRRRVACASSTRTC